MKKPVTLRPRQAVDRVEQKRDADDRRFGSAQRGYDARWGKARMAHLAAHPLCVMCDAEGRIEAATVVDHKIKHGGDPVLFWDSANWQSLCAWHHNRDKQSQERGGFKGL